ncbi:MAG: GTPase ObgE [Eubacteriales bacterium]
MFIDMVKIHLKAGDGGNGSVSFHREKFVAKGGPDGGDGGKGGDIVFEIDPGESTLLHFKTRRHFKAQSGDNGSGSKFYGKYGEDVIIKVPNGTLIKDAESGKIIKDMTGCPPFVVAKGGKGGWGNKHFATPTRQVPNFAKNGLPGEERDVILELKMLADVGLVGYPNAGKSSLLAAASSARPKIAGYHFTTLAPNLGVVHIDETSSFVMADIPGLIEGASQGAGLGHAFLRHIERCRLLVHVVDIAGSEGRDPVDDVDTINAELAGYNMQLLDRPQIIAANKTDLLGEDYRSPELEEYARERGYPVIYISAVTGFGVDELMAQIVTLLNKLPPIEVFESEYVAPEHVEEGHEVEIIKQGDVYFVEGEWLQRLMGSVNFEDRESLDYFQRVLKKSGVIEKLTQSGCKDGDGVSIYGFEFDFLI